MTIEEHARHTFEEYGIRAEEIHKWIDGYFDADGFSRFLQGRFTPGFDPYGHRLFRHCREALAEALREFQGRYSDEQIKNVFETHLKDDYDGYVPSRSDFLQESFREKYHEARPGPEGEKIFSEQELNDYFRRNAYIRKKGFKRNFSGFRIRILLPVLIALSFFALSLFILIVPVFRTSLMDGKKEMIRELTNTAVSIVDYYDGLVRSGELSLQEGQGEALSEIRKIRYGRFGKDYFWIIDRNAVMLMHPYRPDLEGQNLMDYRDPEDPDGLLIFAEVVELVENNGEGYLEYHWQWMDDPDTTALKLSYARGVESWGWIIGTGIYITDVEEETRGLTLTLLGIFALAVLVSGGILLYAVLQSRRIELDRQRAETGLMEAKERYRTLVESSSEGVLLMLEGEAVFVNNALERLTGLDENELLNRPLSEWFTPDGVQQKVPGEFLKQISGGDSAGSEQRGTVRSPGGTRAVVLKATRIFLPQRTGILLQFRKIAYYPPLDEPSHGDLQRSIPEEFRSLFEAVEQATGTGDLILQANRAAGMLKDCMDQGLAPRLHRSLIGEFYERVFRRNILLALENQPLGEVDYAFLILGSGARREMTLFSDQDNAVVFRSGAGQDKEEIRKRLLRIGQEVCVGLEKAGFPFCPGGIMAMNPRWCLEFSEWVATFTGWIREPADEALLYFNSFFDMLPAYGNSGLVSELQGQIGEAVKRNPSFLQHFVRNMLEYGLPLNPRGKLRSDYHDGEKGIDLKHCLKPLEMLIRLYSLEQGLTDAGSLQRLRALTENNDPDPAEVRELGQILEILWKYRFENQLRSYRGLERVNDVIPLDQLTPLDFRILNGTLNSLQERIDAARVRYLGASPLL